MPSARPALSPISFVIALAALSVPATALGAVRVGLLPLERIGPDDPAYDELQAALRRSVSTFSTGSAVDVPAPHGCSVSDAHCIARAGVGAEVDLVVTGSVERFADGFALRLRTVDAKSVEEHEVKRLVQGALPELISVAELASCQLLVTDKCEGTLHVTAPARAHVVLDSHEAGGAPFDGPTAIGRHSLRVTLDGRTTEDRSISVIYHQQTSLRVVERGGALLFASDSEPPAPEATVAAADAAPHYTPPPHFMATPPPEPPATPAPAPVAPQPNLLTDLPPIPDAPPPPPPPPTTAVPATPTVAAPPPEAAAPVAPPATASTAAPPPAVAAPPPVPAAPPVAPTPPGAVIVALPPEGISQAESSASPPPPVLPPPAAMPPPSTSAAVPPEITPPGAALAPPPSAASPQAAPPANGAGTEQPAPSRPPPSEALRAGFITTASMGGAFLIAGIIAGSASQVMANDLNTKSQKKELQPSDLQEYDSARTAATTANVFYGLTGAAAITAATLFLLDPRILTGGGQEHQVRVAVGVAPDGVSVAGHF
jgi:hypothetical protein